jgi:hypothetical protein
MVDRILLLFVVATLVSDRVVTLKDGHGSLNIMTVNGTVVVDQLDLKQAIANLRTPI